MGLLLTASFLLRLGAFVGFGALFVRRRHLALALLALTLASITIGAGARLAPLVSGEGTWSWLLRTPGLGVWRALLISVSAFLCAVLFFRLFAKNDALIAQAQEDARRQALLLRELDHRVRNNLAGLLGLIDLSSGGEEGSETAERLRRRIGAITECHALLTRKDGEATSMPELVAVLSRANPDVRTLALGPDVRLARRLVQPLGMILQELFANARKHGNGGPVQIDWRLGAADEDAFELTWLESGVAEGSYGQGSGLGLVRGLAEYELSGEMTTQWTDEGLRHWIRASLSIAMVGAEETDELVAI